MQMMAKALVAAGLACAVAGIAAAADEDMNDPGMKACERLSGTSKEQCMDRVRQDMRSGNDGGSMNQSGMSGDRMHGAQERGMTRGMQGPSGQGDSGTSGSREQSGTYSR